MTYELRMNNPQQTLHMGRGIVLIVATTVLFSTLDTLSKATNPYLPVNEILWGRYLFHGLALVLLIGPRMKLDLVRTAHPGIQVLRALILMASSLLFVSALVYLLLAEARRGMARVHDRPLPG